jgi:hypothetical protein
VLSKNRSDSKREPFGAGWALGSGTSKRRMQRRAVLERQVQRAQAGQFVEGSSVRCCRTQARVSDLVIVGAAPAGLALPSTARRKVWKSSCSNRIRLRDDARPASPAF